MDAALLTSPAQLGSAADREKQSEHLLDALKAATATPGEQRLFRWGKLAGLFPSRVGPSAQAARFALTSGLLEHVRTEVRGKLVVEWVRAVPKATAYLEEHDSPKAVLRELQDVLGETRAGVPVWMAQARDEAAQLSLRFEHTARRMLDRLDALSDRVEAALRRAEAATPVVGDAMARLVPWAAAALAHLDQRADGSCPVTLAELFAVAGGVAAGLTLSGFHDGARKLHDGGLIRLLPVTPGQVIAEPEYAMEVDRQLMWEVSR